MIKSQNIFFNCIMRNKLLGIMDIRNILNAKKLKEKKIIINKMKKNKKNVIMLIRSKS